MNWRIQSRPRAAAAFLVAAAAAITISGAGCLPGDTRPAPEQVFVTAEPGPGLTLGIETADGWSIVFDRFLLAIGNIDLENDDPACNSYAEAHYDRLFDFTVAGREKVGNIYGLGTCRLEFRLRTPSFDVLLGAGTTKDDVTFMRTRATDRYQDNARVSVLAIGTAAREEESKRFEWVFRRSFELTDCKNAGGGFLTTVELEEGGYSELRIEARPEELFRSQPDDAAPLMFQPIADADADADGAVTLDELSVAAPPDLGAGAPAEAAARASIEAILYEDLLLRVLRVVGGGSCVEEDR